MIAVVEHFKQPPHRSLVVDFVVAFPRISCLICICVAIWIRLWFRMMKTTAVHSMNHVGARNASHAFPNATDHVRTVPRTMEKETVQVERSNLHHSQVVEVPLEKRAQNEIQVRRQMRGGARSGSNPGSDGGWHLGISRFEASLSTHQMHHRFLHKFLVCEGARGVRWR